MNMKKALQAQLEEVQEEADKKAHREVFLGFDVDQLV